MEAQLLLTTCGKCTGWDRHDSGFGYCPTTGKKTARDHTCDAPISDDLPPHAVYELRRWAANKPEPTVFTCYGR